MRSSIRSKAPSVVGAPLGVAPPTKASGLTRKSGELYISGAWRLSGSSDRVPVVNPATELTLGDAPEPTPAEIDAAVTEAASAFKEWSRTPSVERATLLDALAERLQARRDEIARTVTLEVGTPIERSYEWQADQPVRVLRTYADIARTYQFEDDLGNSRILKDAVGVAACIAPWNFPLHQMMLKVAPALAAGCTVVAKPSAFSVFDSFILAESIDACGFPAGVFNLLTGTGSGSGDRLVRHPMVSMISFTGSSDTGAEIARRAGAECKRTVFELGGKSASVVLDDADLEGAVTATVHNCYANAGQTCAAWTRLLVPSSRVGEAEEIATATAKRYVMGDPLDPATTLGPLISMAQKLRVNELVETGVYDGARLLTGGGSAATPSRGFFFAPTVLGSVRPAMDIAREEIFGPVLSILTYEGDEEAVTIANDTHFGLSGAVWSADVARASDVARRMRTGQVFINGAAFNYLAPFGGFGRSGWGREFGLYGLEEYLEPKAVQF